MTTYCTNERIKKKLELLTLLISVTLPLVTTLSIFFENIITMSYLNYFQISPHNNSYANISLWELIHFFTNGLIISIILSIGVLTVDSIERNSIRRICYLILPLIYTIIILSLISITDRSLSLLSILFSNYTIILYFFSSLVILSTYIPVSHIKKGLDMYRSARYFTIKGNNTQLLLNKIPLISRFSDKLSNITYANKRQKYFLILMILFASTVLGYILLVDIGVSLASEKKEFNIITDDSLSQSSKEFATITQKNNLALIIPCDIDDKNSITLKINDGYFLIDLINKKQSYKKFNTVILSTDTQDTTIK